MPLANVNRLIALNPTTQPSFARSVEQGAQDRMKRDASDMQMRQAMEQEQRQNQNRQMQQQQRANINRMMQMGASIPDIARAGGMQQAEALSQIQRRGDQSTIDRDKYGLDQRRLELEERQHLAKQQPGAQDKPRVQQATLHKGGGATILYADGKLETKRPEEVDAQFIKEAEMRGAEIQGLRAGERKAAGVAQTKSKDSFEQAFKIRQNVSTLHSVIDEVKAGAGTGALKSRLPSLRASSVRLDNLQKRLGLDLIQATTFGALSESELQFALDTVLPKQLDGQELVQWTEGKIAAQTKLAEELEDLAIYLGTPGNKLSSWLIDQKKERKRPQQGQDGNKAQGSQQTQVGRFQVKVK